MLMNEYSFPWLNEAREREFTRELERRRVQRERAAEARAAEAAAVVDLVADGGTDAARTSPRTLRWRTLPGRHPRHA